MLDAALHGPQSELTEKFKESVDSGIAKQDLRGRASGQRFSYPRFYSNAEKSQAVKRMHEMEW